MMKTFLKSTGEEVFPMGYGSFAKLITTDSKGRELVRDGSTSFNPQNYQMVGFLTGNTKPGSKRMDVRSVRKEKLTTRHGY
jgi:hypothetical protein